jgi:Glycosyl hydrolase family 20, catalytic domain
LSLSHLRPGRRDFLQATGLAATGVLMGCGTPVSTRTVGDGEGEALRVRGIAVDAARLPEPVTYYRRLIDFCREWNLNALLFRLTDDQGSALRWQSHPELLTHPHALTSAEARSLAQYGQRQGVMVIPEIESFGHTRYITSVAEHAALEDRDPRDGRGFTGLCPVAPETLSIMSDLYREAAAIFPTPYLHGGCDEVNWGGSARSQRALRAKSRAEIWAEYVNALDEICRRLGKALIIWGDAVLHRQPDILPRLTRRVIVMDWQYQTLDRQPLARLAQRVIDAGHGVIGAPALVSCWSGPRPGEPQRRNVDAFADAYASLRGPGCLGVVVTNWVPTRYIQASLWDGFAYAAVALDRGSAVARQSAFRSFVERFYEAAWSAAWQDIFDRYYRVAPSWGSCASTWPGPRLAMPWASDDDLRRALGTTASGPSPYGGLRTAMGVAHATVRRHVEDFAALALSAEHLDHVFWREAVVKAAGPAPGQRDAARLIESVASRDRGLLAKLETDWNTGRFSDAPGKREVLPGLEPADQLFLAMSRAARFSAQLANDGERFYRLLLR